MVGTSGVRAAVKRAELALVVVAADRSDRTINKVVRLAEACGVPWVTGPPAVELGRSIGRGAVQAVGVRDRPLAAGIEAGLSGRT